MKYIVLYRDPETSNSTYHIVETEYGKPEAAKIFHESNPSIRSFQLTEATLFTTYKVTTTVKEVP